MRLSVIVSLSNCLPLSYLLTGYSQLHGWLEVTHDSSDTTGRLSASGGFHGIEDTGRYITERQVLSHISPPL